ncbi:MAG: glycosyltransferase family protein [Neomegalonema sp.]
MKVLISVTHLLGTGHLARAIALADAFASAGHDALILSGGMPAPHLHPGSTAKLVQVPPVRSDGVDFANLLDPDGRPVADDYRSKRETAFNEALQSFEPDVVITELFPFGRRVLAGEFESLLRAARALAPRPLVFCSIRDVLAPPSSEKKAQQTSDRIRDFYDGVMVHGDPGITPLEQSWPVTPEIAAKLAYTGFIAPTLPAAAPEGDGADEVLVTAGGGPVGDSLFRASVAAAANSGKTWRLLVGGGDRETRMAELRKRATPNVIIESVRPDFREVLQRAALSVSQAGYNTMMDLAASGAPAVLVPFEDGGETEQLQRAEAFAKRFPMTVLRDRDLTPERLLTAVRGALERPRPHVAAEISLDGAARSVEVIEEALKR